MVQKSRRIARDHLRTRNGDSSEPQNKKRIEYGSTLVDVDGRVFSLYGKRQVRKNRSSIGVLSHADGTTGNRLATQTGGRATGYG